MTISERNSRVSGMDFWERCRTNSIHFTALTTGFTGVYTVAGCLFLKPESDPYKTLLGFSLMAIGSVAYIVNNPARRRLQNEEEAMDRHSLPQENPD